MKVKKIIMSLGLLAGLLVMTMDAAEGSKKAASRYVLDVEPEEDESEEKQGWWDWIGEGLETAASFGYNTTEKKPKAKEPVISAPKPVEKKKEESFFGDIKNEAKEVLGEIASEGKKELKTAAKVAVAAGIVAGVGTAATLGGVFKDWLVEKIKGFFSKTEENEVKETKKGAAPTDHSKQRFYAEEKVKLKSVKESIDENNVQEAVKKIQKQEEIWEHLPDVTKEEPDFEQLLNEANALKQQLVGKVSAGINAILQKLNENSLTDFEEENSAAQSRFEEARSFEDAQKAITRLTKNSTSIETMAQALAKLGQDVKAVKTIVTDNAKFNSLITTLNNTLKEKFDPAAAQQLLQTTKDLIATYKNKLDEAKRNAAAAQTNAA